MKLFAQTACCHKGQLLPAPGDGLEIIFVALLFAVVVNLDIFRFTVISYLKIGRSIHFTVTDKVGCNHLRWSFSMFGLFKQKWSKAALIAIDPTSDTEALAFGFYWTGFIRVSSPWPWRFKSITKNKKRRYIGIMDLKLNCLNDILPASWALSISDAESKHI